jgi:hypothetical protein
MTGPVHSCAARRLPRLSDRALAGHIALIEQIFALGSTALPRLWRSTLAERRLDFPVQWICHRPQMAT